MIVGNGLRWWQRSLVAAVVSGAATRMAHGEGLRGAMEGSDGGDRPAPLAPSVGILVREASVLYTYSPKHVKPKGSKHGSSAQVSSYRRVEPAPAIDPNPPAPTVAPVGAPPAEPAQVPEGTPEARGTASLPEPTSANLAGLPGGPPEQRPPSGPPVVSLRTDYVRSRDPDTTSGGSGSQADALAAENARLKAELALWRHEASLRPPEPFRAAEAAAVELSDDENPPDEENASYDEESPLHPDLQRVRFGSNFRAAKLPKYSGDSDPGEFSRSYALAIEASGGSRDTMAKCFPLALEGIALRWFWSF
ncbi:hypothetical protein GUJ93_ZPchr0006g44935 [Zizania palustris]|uniref:Uncharacterized protein n=1 Tax=Zizania palustris TaxID=103762 RepID=A0A8J5W521_ZIZPA|nr:hypothetical protein GUJ93_ZPchr0006g44935 [Zizania palustris]